MEVDIEVEPAAEPLDDGDAAGLAAEQTAPPGAPALEGEQGARVDPEHGAAQGVIPGREIAQAVGQAQHPLTDWDVRQHVAV